MNLPIWLAGPTRRRTTDRRRQRARRLRIETLESRDVPSTTVGDSAVMGPLATKDFGSRPALLQAPKMAGIADLDPAVASAVRHAWQVPPGTQTANWVVQLPAGQSPNVFRAIGGVPVREVPYWDHTYEVEFPNELDVATFPAVLAGVTEAEFFYPVVPLSMTKRYVPNDPQFGAQWHLRNTGQGGGTAGQDANLVPAWDVLDVDGVGTRGDGVVGNPVVIGVVDDGLQTNHVDLAPNYRSIDSWDFNGNDPNPTPAAGDAHGTAVAGVAAARGGNGTGVSGSAPSASLAGLRLLGANFDDTQTAAALSYRSQSIDIYNNSWGPADNGLLGPIGVEALGALQAGYNTGRGGLGNIYTWAAGNGLGANDNVNYDGFANSRYVIAVGAVNNFGRQSGYSEPGAPMLVTAPSDGGSLGITTTTAPSGYTNSFGGTSSATPLVSGIIALMLDANPDLTVRDVQNILVKTARKNDAADAGWIDNAAGYHVNHKYGFGTIDAHAAVSTAAAWPPVPGLGAVASGPISVNLPVPENDPTGVTSTTTISQDMSIEHVEVVLNATQTWVGDYRVVLTAPSGTQSVLAETHNDDGDGYVGWVFSSVRHWGESPVGTWTLQVVDGAAQDVGTFVDWTLRVYGTSRGESPLVSAVEPATRTYVAGQGEIVVTNTVAVADADNNTLNGATVTIANNYVAAEDFLRFTNRGAIAGSFANGVLTLSGSASLAQYQAALRTVRYENTSLTPSAATRRLAFRVTDPTGRVSNAGLRRIAVKLADTAPTLNPIAEPAAINEDAGLQSINLAGISAGAGENQPLTVTATSSNPGLIPDPTVNYTDPAATGSLSYTPAADQFGTAVITVRVKDDGGTANGGTDEVTRTFTVNVNSSNDAPDFTSGPAPFVLFGSGAQLYPGWATGITAGPANESSQVLAFNLTNDNNALFSVQPAIASDGTLTFTPAPGALGTATVSATLTDDGGTAFGGVDASPTKDFTIVVDVNDAPTVSGTIPQLTTVPKYRTDPAGDLAAAASGNISDADQNQFKGLAVVGLTGTSGGTWEFSLNGGANWQPFGNVSPTAARLVRQQDRIRFVPNGGYVGSPEITYHAWDQVSDAAGDVIDLTVANRTGGETSFSVGTARARVRVAPALTTVIEDSKKNRGDKAAALLTGLTTDADLKAKVGLAITGLDAAGFGTWQFSTNGGRAWSAMPAVGPANALLLGDKDVVRFLPAAEQSGEARFYYHAWDQTTGTRGKTADLSAAGSTGGGTPFSAAEDVFFVRVTPENDRPVPDKSWQPRVAPAGSTIADLVGASITDADGDPRGIAVIGARSALGAWEYRLNGTANWVAVGIVSVKAALPLRDIDELRFVANAGAVGTAKLTYRAWDRTEGTAGTPADARKATAFSTTTHAALAVLGGTPAPANGAPELDTLDAPILSPVPEDTTKPFGDAVSRLLGTAFSDPDADARRGIAVVGLTGTADGRWEFSINGGKKWTAMSAVSETHALLLRDTDWVRFVPARDFVGTRTLTYRAWDQSEGTGGQYADLTLPATTGGNAAVGLETESAAVTVTQVNDAPVFNTTRVARFSPQAKGDPNPTGDTVAVLLGTSVTDPDPGALQGIAVTKVDVIGGTWEYRMSGGPGWLTIPASVAPSFALALRSQDEVRFRADATFEGVKTLKFQAWDQSEWSAGILVPAAGGKAFSKASRMAELTITPGNDRPILDPKAVRPLSPVAPNDPAPAGDTVAFLLGTAVVDPDGPAVPQGIAITAADARNGWWQFSTNGGTSWQNVDLVSKTGALLLRSQDMVRFVPNAGYLGSAKMTFVAWDQSSGVVGTKVPTSGTGVTAFSLLSATSIVKVNTAPTLNL